MAFFLFGRQSSVEVVVQSGASEGERIGFPSLFARNMSSIYEKDEPASRSGGSGHADPAVTVDLVDSRTKK